jgi:hypothetical protein
MGGVDKAMPTITLLDVEGTGDVDTVVAVTPMSTGIYAGSASLITFVSSLLKAPSNPLVAARASELRSAPVMPHAADLATFNADFPQESVRECDLEDFDSVLDKEFECE